MRCLLRTSVEGCCTQPDDPVLNGADDVVYLFYTLTFSGNILTAGRVELVSVYGGCYCSTASIEVLGEGCGGMSGC